MRASRNDRTRLDRRLAAWKTLPAAAPPRGWLRAVRDALGMSQADLAARLDVTRQRIAQIEQAEVDGSIQLKTLRRAAEAMDCLLVYAIVPNTTLEDTVYRQAFTVVANDVDRARQTMLLEAQLGGEGDHERLRESIVEQLLDSRRLWRS
jgi:predicted DNA-binding mobile mystery protein A